MTDHILQSPPARRARTSAHASGAGRGRVPTGPTPSVRRLLRWFFFLAQLLLQRSGVPPPVCGGGGSATSLQVAMMRGVVRTSLPAACHEPLALLPLAPSRSSVAAGRCFFAGRGGGAIEQDRPPRRPPTPINRDLSSSPPSSPPRHEEDVGGTGDEDEHAGAQSGDVGGDDQRQRCRCRWGSG